MKNSNFLPYERNKYFYGKLLSVDDFNLEQRYMNDKRRLGNRFGHGCGVVSGLTVVRVEEDAVSVEAGIAFDSTGREIVVETPVTRKLSLIDGFEGLEIGQQGEAYLCIEYDEKEVSRVHNIAGRMDSREERTDFNKIKENYRLFLTQQEPETPLFGIYDLCLGCNELYHRDGIVIRQYLPRVAMSGQTATLRIEVENHTRKYVSFSYELSLTGLSQEGRTSAIIDFNEMQYEKTGVYQLEIPLLVTGSRGTTASAGFQGHLFHLFFDQKEQETEEGNAFLSTRVTKENLFEELKEIYYQGGMERILKKSQSEKLYLARISFSNPGGMFSITNIKNVPFRQYVASAELMGAHHFLDTLMQNEQKEAAEGAGGKKGPAASLTKEKGGVRISQGEVWLDLNGGGQRGMRFVTDEITHGLGLGQVHVFVGVEDKENSVTYGSSEVFEDMPVEMELAVRVFPEKGTFQIGARLVNQVIKSGVKLYWTAVADSSKNDVEQSVRKIFIKPGVLEMETRQTHYLETVCTNMTDKTVVWSVKEHGGEITENGVYTAPNVPGVYEVSATSLAYPDVKASIFIVVREP